MIWRLTVLHVFAASSVGYYSWLNYSLTAHLYQREVFVYPLYARESPAPIAKLWPTRGGIRQFSAESRLSRLFKSMTGVALSGSCNSLIQGKKRDLSRVFHPESCFSIILTRVKILVVFITPNIVKALTLNGQQIVWLCNSLTFNGQWNWSNF
jgi:hypothetical protein